MSPEDQLHDATEAFRRGDIVQGLALVQNVAAAFGDRKDVFVRAVKVLLGSGQAVEALLLLEQGLVKFPTSGAILDSFRTAIAHTKNDAKAAKVLSDIIARLPDNAEQMSTLGRFLLGHGELKIATLVLQRAYTISHEDPQILAALGTCFFQMNRKEDAVAVLKEALKLAPDNVDLQHMLASFSGADVSAAPLAFIEGLFDAYADSFDKDLVDKLKYQTPQDVLAILKSIRPEIGIFDRFLDVGCGTGLIAGALKTHYRISESVGVDLSRKMLDVAASKNLYRELLCGNAMDILYDISAMFDLIAAIDVPVYMGDLRPLTAAVAERLQSGGLYVYSIETMPVGNYKLLPTQRFAHTVQYVEDVAASFGLEPVAGMKTVIRLDAGNPLPGYVGVFVKSSVGVHG